MKTKAKSCQVFEVWIWSRKYYGKKVTPKKDVNIFSGFVEHVQTKTEKTFHSPAEFLTIIEELYRKAEKK